MYCALTEESVVICQPLLWEEIAFEYGRISDFQLLVTSTLTLDRVILYTVMHQSSTSTYILTFIEIEKTFCGGLLTANFKVT